MQSNKQRRQSTCARISRINGVSMPQRDWFVVYPEIKLRGEWLDKIGFHPGRKVCITSSENELVISLIK